MNSRQLITRKLRMVESKELEELDLSIADVRSAQTRLARIRQAVGSMLDSNEKQQLLLAITACDKAAAAVKSLQRSITQWQDW